MATTASAMIALVAVAVAMTPAAHARVATADTRSIVGEAPSVRAVAQAVAAAARDLVGGERIDAANIAVSLPDLTLLLITGWRDSNQRDQMLGIPLIAEQLLDLPPPGR